MNYKKMGLSLKMKKINGSVEVVMMAAALKSMILWMQMYLFMNLIGLDLITMKTCSPYEWLSINLPIQSTIKTRRKRLDVNHLNNNTFEKVNSDEKK